MTGRDKQVFERMVANPAVTLSFTSMKSAQPVQISSGAYGTIAVLISDERFINFSKTRFSS